MELEDYLRVAAFGMQTALAVSTPVLLFGLTAGVLVSIFQAATQINDAALAFLPKIVATIVALFLFGPWMVAEMADFSEYAFSQIPNVTR